MLCPQAVRTGDDGGQSTGCRERRRHAGAGTGGRRGHRNARSGALPGAAAPGGADVHAAQNTRTTIAGWPACAGSPNNTAANESRGSREGTMGTTINGYCHEKFERVRDAFAANFANGSDLGASFAVDRRRRIRRRHLGRPPRRRKAAAVEGRHHRQRVLHDQDDGGASARWCSPTAAKSTSYEKVAKYWPEFAQNGKADVEVRHFMSHSAGLSGMDGPLITADAYDWDKMTPAARGASAVVEAGHAERLSRDHAGLSDRRSRPPRHRLDARHVFPQAKSPNRSAPISTSASIRAISRALAI